MSRLFDFLKILTPSVDKIFEYPILDDRKKCIGWSSIVRDKDGYPLSGGTDFSREIARLKSLYEAIERGAIRNIYIQNGDLPFQLNKYPTTNGFACGPSESFTIEKSIAESFERYLWDLWIDKKISLFNIQTPILSELANNFCKSFEKYEFYGLEFTSNLYQTEKKQFFLVCIGYFGNGIFWGSNISDSCSGKSLDHAIFEASRNLKTFRSGECKISDNYEDIILQKYGECGIELFEPAIGENKLLNLNGKFEVLQSSELTENIWIARAIIN